ncbi:hypothetical protein PoB_006600800 [Plakobranchus ocellatus]|uniref:Uncharacterized protein n=1 Tax=Plakobranchus ocellatus TaxID=259542 RepID=A0AAV4D621_9GAST|nr:hypothetical protein PoB_006600800 [Plakobranchus ocellatus]
MQLAAQLLGDAKGPEAPTAIDIVRVGNEAEVTETSMMKGLTRLVCARNKAATVQEAPMARDLVHAGLEIHRSSTVQEAPNARGLVHMGIDAVRSLHNERSRIGWTTQGYRKPLRREVLGVWGGGLPVHGDPRLPCEMSYEGENRGGRWQRP